MKNLAVHRHRQRLQLLIDRTTAATGGDIEMEAEWAKYICVQIAGYIENIVRELYSDYVSNKAHPSVASFCQENLRGILNPKSNRLLEIAGEFSLTWRSNLESFLADDGRKDAIDTIMNNRHLIAHGRNCTISLGRVTEYLRRIDTVAEYISDSLDAGI